MTSILDIILTPTGQGTYQAEGRDADGTVVARHVFRHRPDLLATHQQLQALEQGATLSGDEETQIPALLAEAEAFGQDLYEKLFGGELGGRWADLRAEAQAAGQPVRLRLRMAEDAPELDALPWEFLHDGQTFLAPDRRVLLARGVAALPDFAVPEAETGPLAVLVVVSTPLDLPEEQAFEPDEELAVIYEALDEPLRKGRIQIEVVDEASLGQMQRALIARDCQVVHFIGHGNFDERRGGCLVVETEEGNATPLDGAGFAHLLAGRGVRLVLLSSCLTARASPTQAYRSVAGALLRQGLPAVVAMQYPILITSARTFYRTVYEALAADRPLDVAVAEGQQALYLEGDRKGSPLQWATPALFSRGAGDWRLGVDARAATPPTPKVELSSLGGLEDIGRSFVGRQREQRLVRRAFLRDEARAALIHGFGGIGKTVLATRLARRLAETGRFDGVLGLRARPDLRADEILRAFNDFFTSHGIAAFDPVLRAPIPLAQKVDALAGVLRQVRLVVLLDNCEDWLVRVEGKHQVKDPDLAALLAGLLAALERGSKLLLTSRYRFDALPPGRLSGALLSVPLGELGRGEAVRLMGTLPALRETDYATRLRVFQAVGGHPFVLNLLAERAARDGVDHVLADVKTVRREAEEVGRLLLQQIVDGLSEMAKSLLEQAGVLRRPAPRGALEALAGTHRIGEALDELMGWGLMTQARYDDELCAEPENRYAMHALVREAMKGRLEIGDWRLALLALAGFYADEGRLKTLRYGNVQVFNLLEARHYYFQASEYHKAARIVEQTVEYLSRWGLIETCEALLQESVDTTEGEPRARALGNLAVTVYQPRGNYARAAEVYEEVRDLFKALGDKRNEATALHQLGIVQYLQGNYAQAVRLYEQSLQIAEEVGYKAGVASSLHQLGMIQQDQGHHTQAVRLYEQSRQLKEELGDKAGVATALHQLGIVQYLQGNYAQAVRLYEQSLQLKKELGDKAGVANSLGQMGNLHYVQGNYTEAVKCYEQCLSTFEELRDKSGVALSLHQLGMIQQDQGHYAQAVCLYEQSLQIEEELGNKAGVASSWGQMGKLAQAQGRHKEAMSCYLRALALFQALHSPSAQLAMRDLASVQAEVGEAQFAAWWEELTVQLGSEAGTLRPEEAAVPSEEEESQPEGMTLGQAAEQIADNTILAMTQRNPAQRGQLWEALGQLRSQAAGHEELRGLVAFLDAVRWLLEGRPPDEVELEAPFTEAWQRIQQGIEGA